MNNYITYNDFKTYIEGHCIYKLIYQTDKNILKALVKNDKGLYEIRKDIEFESTKKIEINTAFKTYFDSLISNGYKFISKSETEFSILINDELIDYINQEFEKIYDFDNFLNYLVKYYNFNIPQENGIKIVNFGLLFENNNKDEEIPKIQKLYFKNIIFNQNIRFSNINIDELIIGNNVKFKDVNIYDIDEIGTLKFFGEQIEFGNINISKSNIKNFSIISNLRGEYLNLQGLTFEDTIIKLGRYCMDVKINFSFCKFNNKTNSITFGDTIFKKPVIFNQAEFNSNVYFNNSTFEDTVDFSNTKFSGIASFYNVKFKKTPNFLQAIFKDSINLANSKLDIEFDELKQEVKEQAKDKIEDEIKIVNDFRDTFRNFKSTLIKDNNLLDASEYHKAELYCKEIELYKNATSKGVEATNIKDVRSNARKVKDFIHSLHLGFYRNLCDHHTDLLKMLNNFVILIALHGLYICNYIKPKQDTNNSINNNLFIDFKNFHIIDNNIALFILLIILAIIIICLCLFIRSVKIKKIVKNIIANFMIYKNQFIVDIKFLTYCIAFLLLVTLIYALSSSIINKGNSQYYIAETFISFSFICIYISLISLQTIFLRYIICVISYTCFISIFINYTYLLNPMIANIFEKDVLSNFKYDTLFILITFIYNFLFVLLAFSLQKTARKNSIVPS
ncbi:hypothetical protein CIG2463D_0898 [Campylobacter iguaniorum]|uniref:pentapeptide repeat-containing protein n=1 Tax=Campylobacter iguaniorum TaxID=1244531 RepID=UPI00073A0E39|nr:pentapeptide repeat-containing protein [Campylobacter iguaniorum]ALV24471.1 hypothetical protein CIG2463D_0898 [Campylobacter iguaniorum]